MTRYLYAATALLLAIFYGAAVVTMNALLHFLSDAESDFQTRQALATGVGVLVVAGPLWWLHWRGLRWQVDHARPTVQHQYRTYLAVIAGLAIFAIFSSAGASVTLLLRLALGLVQDSQTGWSQGFPWLIALVTATAVWWLHWQPLLRTEVLAQRRENSGANRAAPIHRVHR